MGHDAPWIEAPGKLSGGHMAGSEKASSVSYEDSGVSTDEAERGLDRIIGRIKRTWPAAGLGRVALDIGYYANIVDLQGVQVAITTDGVGTNAIVAQMLGRYDTVGIDCIAMNVNDLICVGARPVTLVDYIATQTADSELLDQLAAGLCAGAETAGISISGGEIAQLPEIITGHPHGKAFDLAGTAIGVVPPSGPVIGEGIGEGDAVVGIESNGVHSNGLTLARKVLFEKRGLAVDARLPGLSGSVGEELLRPTHIYVREAMELLDAGIGVKALAHITSDGLLNLTRVASAVGYVIDEFPEIPPIFRHIQHDGLVSDAEMFRVFNMGIGFCFVLPEENVAKAVEIAGRHGKRAVRIGRALPDPRRRVEIPAYGLVGEGKEFRKRTRDAASEG